MTLITIICRGHGGTCVISHTLQASGVYMGHPLNVSGDLLPPGPMYEACRVLAHTFSGWGICVGTLAPFTPCPFPEEFIDLIERI